MLAALEGLLSEHRAIIAGADRMLAAMRQTPRIGMEELSRLRAEHSALLRAHIKAEEEHLYRRVPALAPADRPAGLADVARAMRDLHGGYSDHIRTWHTRSIENDWAGYTRATAALIGRLRALVAREEAELYRPLMALAARQTGSAHPPARTRP